MRPVRFSYVRPRSVDEAVECLGTFGTGARVLAGGQSLLALMNRRLVRPAVLVDLSGLQSLRHLSYDGGALRIGALATHRDIETVRDHDVQAAFGVLTEAARLIGHLPVRTRGTFGGSIAHADPAAEWCVAAVLLDAAVLVAGPHGNRAIAAGDFFTGGRRGTGERRTALRPGEIIVEVRLPRAAPTAALVEFALQEGHFAVAVAAAEVELDAVGCVAAARIALGGVADRPIRVPWVERAIIGCTADEALPEHAAGLAASGLPVGTPTELSSDAVGTGPDDGSGGSNPGGSNPGGSSPNGSSPSGASAAGWAGDGTEGRYRTELAAALTARALRASIMRATIMRSTSGHALRYEERAGLR